MTAMDEFKLDGYSLHLTARRERAAMQAELLLSLAAATHRAWAHIWTTCKRRLRLREIAEA